MSNNDTTTDVQMAGNTLDEVKRFKYLAAFISEEVFDPEVLARIAQATAALSIMKEMPNDSKIEISSSAFSYFYRFIVRLPIGLDLWTL